MYWVLSLRKWHASLCVQTHTQYTHARQESPAEPSGNLPPSSKLQRKSLALLGLPALIIFRFRTERIGCVSCIDWVLLLSLYTTRCFAVWVRRCTDRVCMCVCVFMCMCNDMSRGSRNPANNGVRWRGESRGALHSEEKKRTFTPSSWWRFVKSNHKTQKGKDCNASNSLRLHGAGKAYC